ncbi:unnamed protein product [Leptosia nina]|uniref:Uncharacterized protein n=1 Tax=Leptosia nina TaxID=320188 RepID=A0AAV1JH36_9NEOP
MTYSAFPTRQGYRWPARWAVARDPAPLARAPRTGPLRNSNASVNRPIFEFFRSNTLVLKCQWKTIGFCNCDILSSTGSEVRSVAVVV